jgi:integrase/recombinase XerD
MDARGGIEMSKQRKAPPGTVWKQGILWGRIRLKGRPAFVRPLDTDDPKLAAQRFEKIKAEFTGRVKHGEARYSFEEAAQSWGAGLTDRVSEKTAARYLCSLAQITSYLDGKFIEQINGALIADIVNGRRATGVTVSTIKRDLVALSSVMGFCIDEGWLEANPVLPRLGRLKERRVPIVLPELADIATVIAKAAGTMRPVINAALATGCRQSEVVTAKVSMFSDNRRQLIVIGKRNKMRTLDLSDEAYTIIREAARNAKGPWLFPSEDGGPYLATSVQTNFYRLVKNLGDTITRFRFHDLRHRFAVDYLKNKVGSIYELQQHLGHTSVKTTEMYLDYLSAPEKHAAQFGR